MNCSKCCSNKVISSKGILINFYNMQGLKKWLSLLLVLFITNTAYSQQNYWQQELQYRIDVQLNDSNHTINGFLQLQYKNNAPDTLTYIWFHLWPNAFKNDKTAFSEQLLRNGRTDYYFSKREQRGYINRLDFRQNNITLKTEDHPAYIDVIKVLLNQPLAPGASIEITTPFHVKLPDNFSRGGHQDQEFQITQWYPKPAVYDRNGWHPMPYLDQGEFYSEFGSYDVRITLPENYVVAATGNLQNQDEIDWLKGRAGFKLPETAPVKNKKWGQPTVKAGIPSAKKTKTLQYKQDRIHDFAWFASKRFVVQQDQITLPSGKKVNAYAFYTPDQASQWAGSMKMIRNALLFRSREIGEYPFDVVSVVAAPMAFAGGMEYPTITSISPISNEKDLDITIQHEIGHNWFQGILANNERLHPWMDEGLNTFYDLRYEAEFYPANPKAGSRLFPSEMERVLLNALGKECKDQPFGDSSVAFAPWNYGLSVYYKTAYWLQDLERKLGKPAFDKMMRAYYEQWKFKHPQPSDFLNLLEQQGGVTAPESNAALLRTGMIDSMSIKRPVRFSLFFDASESHKKQPISLFPLLGGNVYDGIQIGAGIHNYTLPASKLQFIIAPFFATRSKALNGIGRIGYTWRPSDKIEKMELSLSGARFSTLAGIDSNQTRIFGSFQKLTPALRLTFKSKDKFYSRISWLEWKTFLIGEKGFRYSMSSADSLFYPALNTTENRFVNQLSFVIQDYRALYPFDVTAQIQQGKSFYRASVTANYFFNYANGGGAGLRFNAVKFGYIGGKTASKEFETIAYQPKLTAVRGYEDYTYSNYFLGRNENEGLASQQIMMRDGGLKIRTDLFQDLQGRSDNWTASLNLTTTLPPAIVPKFLPLRLFLDVGTYAPVWKRGSSKSRFLYVGGIQLSLLKGGINIYAPLLYSKEFRDNLKTVPEENKFLRRISFSIDLQRWSLRKLTGNQFPF